MVSFAKHAKNVAFPVRRIFKSVKTADNRKLLFKSFSNGKVVKRLTVVQKTVKCELMKCDTKLRLVRIWRIVKNPIKE